MKTNMRFCSALAQFFLEGEMLKTKVVEYIQTHFFSITVFEIRAVYKIKWKNIVERGMPQLTIWRMRLACWTTKATNTHSS
jgi:hypothetical protein